LGKQRRDEYRVSAIAFAENIIEFHRTSKNSGLDKAAYGTFVFHFFACVINHHDFAQCQTALPLATRRIA